MGVPAFYRWLSEKYPKIVQDVLEERVHLAPNSASIRLPFDLNRPNPSNLECDNFYIDMNGIIHPCSHPEVGPQPKCEEDMYENVCRYVDRLFRAARPRRMLYLAIDGVAPRAKMNQQRSRRFRGAQEAREQMELQEEIKQSLVEAGHQFEKKVTKPWDSNVITPGTSFMLNLSEYVKFYVRKRISTDPAWKKITVIFSDASIPGEGEHKIMSHIRYQRTQANYNPNLVHILHGLDADLIMLALATHETHFYIMREEVLFGRKGAEAAERMREESGFADAQQQLDEGAGAEAMSLPENRSKILQRISIPILREYLAFEFGDLMKQLPGAGFKEVSFERLIDDFVFLCFFVGNDFLPHLPSLDIRDGALDFLFNVYKRILPTLGDFITSHGGEVNLSHVDVILAEVGAIEDYVFQMKHDNEQSQKRRKEEMMQRRKRLKNGHAPYYNQNANNNNNQGNEHKTRGRAARILEKQNSGAAPPGSNGPVSVAALKKTKENQKKSLEDNNRVAEELKASFVKGNNGGGEKEGTSTEGNTEEEGTKSLSKRKSDQISTADENGDGARDKEVSEESNTNGDSSEGNGIMDVDTTDDKGESEEVSEEPSEEERAASLKVLKNQMKELGQKKLNDYAENVDDKVRLHESGWKNRYYTDKCKADDVLQYGGKEHLFRSYVVGLCWVMKYYYDGCPSWKWFYPFHYAPFASDLKNIERFEKDCIFEVGEPFKPVEQLMAVLPEDSSHAIPKASRWFMSDKGSPILDFYPKDVPCDPNGKAMPWLWVVLLPFIDEERLLENLHPSMKDWTPSELLCNARGLDDAYIFCHVSHELSSSLVPALDSEDKKQKLAIEDIDLFGQLRCPLSSEIYPLDKVSVIEPPSSSVKIHSENHDELLTSPIETNAAICAAFTEPAKITHQSVLLPGAQPPPPVLGQSDYHIRRPRLNRGGGTIANMGGGKRGQSHQVGYGSMNIGSYERDLANKSGRGNQLNKAGTRQWGSLAPVPTQKRHHHNQGQHQHGQHQQGQQLYRPSFQQGQSNSHNSRHPQGNGQHGGRQDRRWQPNSGPANQGNRWQPPNNQGNRWQPPPPSRNFPPPPPPPHQQRFQPPPSQPRRGHNFQNFNQQQSSNRGGHPHSRHGQPQQQQPRNAVSSDVMGSLRSQLASTLSRNRQGNSNGKKK